MMERVSGCKAVMWGTDIVGFCKYHYKYASGHEGDSGYIGFSSRKGDISVYLTSGFESPEAKGFLAQLGKHKIGKVCLYIKRLSDVNVVHFGAIDCVCSGRLQNQISADRRCDLELSDFLSAYGSTRDSSPDKTGLRMTETPSLDEGQSCRPPYQKRRARTRGC